MRSQIPYGRTFFDLHLNERWDPLPYNELNPLDDPEESLIQSLENPIESPPLRRLLREAKCVTIVVSDGTRPTGASIFLPPLLDYLNSFGIPDQKIQILFSLGIHMAQTPDQQKEILGPAVVSRCRAFDHDSRSATNNSHVGTTRRGTLVSLNSTAVKSNLVILTGAIGFHYLAGFSGGRKSIVPGIASYDTCVAWHRLSLDARGQRHFLARTGVLRDNPLHEESIEAARFLPHTFLVNTVLNRNREIAGFFCGDVIRAHEEGSKDYERSHVVEIESRREAVIVGCGGHPRDLNFIQAHKAIEHASEAVKEGGWMIVAAECSQGMGTQTFLSWFDLPSLAGMEEKLSERFEINGQTAHALRTKVEQFKILLMSELRPEEVVKMGMTPIGNLEEGMGILRKHLGGNHQGWVIPDAVTQLPRIRAARP